MKQVSRRSLSIVMTLLYLGAVGVQAQTTPQPAVKIGLILPYRGIWAQIAERLDRGFMLAIEEYGGKVAGRPVEVVRADDELTPSVGVQRFNKLVQSDQVDIIAGILGSNVAIALSELADKAKKPIVFAGAFADEVTGKYCSPYVGRTSFSTNGFQYNAGKYWATHGVKTAVLLGPDYSYGHATLGAFKRGFEEAGGKVVLELWTPFQKTKDWGAALTQASASGAQIIYSAYAGNEAAQVVRQHSEFGLKAKMPLIGDQWVYDESLWASFGDVIYGAKFVASYFPGAEDPVNVNFVNAYRNKFKEDPDMNAALGYDNAKSILATLEKLGRMPADGTQFISALRNADFEAPRGRIRFNQQNSALLEKVYVLQIVRGADGKPRRQLIDTFAGAPDLPTCTRSM